MPDINDAPAVRFANEKLRVAANKLAQAHFFGLQVLAEWTAAGGTDLIPNTLDSIDDGSDVDGRPRITGVDANDIINRLSELVADYEASSSAKLNTILQVAPNPGG